MVQRASSSQIDLFNYMNNDDNWKRTNKKVYKAYVCRPKLGYTFRNKVTGENCQTNKSQQFVLCGTLGQFELIDFKTLVEEYNFSGLSKEPITQDRLARKLDKDGQMDWEEISSKSGKTCRAIFIPNNLRDIRIDTVYGPRMLNMTGVNNLHGDYLVCEDDNGYPNKNTLIHVSGAIFPSTYDLSGFRNMYTDSMIRPTLNKPASILESREGSSEVHKALFNIAYAYNNLGHKVGNLRVENQNSEKVLTDYDRYEISVQDRGMLICTLSERRGREVVPISDFRYMNNHEEIAKKIDSITGPEVKTIEAFKKIVHAINNNEKLRKLDNPKVSGAKTNGVSELVLSWEHAERSKLYGDSVRIKYTPNTSSIVVIMQPSNWAQTSWSGSLPATGLEKALARLIHSEEFLFDRIKTANQRGNSFDSAEIGRVMHVF